ncbi:hypothetical protein WJX81_004360 [Elliptochloris bilobata]|uniref:t-SNARE coiled-coil homology domain-containing protein n=1 Tax=Elliptochloris bilobata TaxID=381761 RepID=A0AAW1R3T8_9CHLO
MSWEPENKRQNGNYGGDYSAEEAAVVDHAKRVHKETTASAQRALKTAERTRELAANTVAELGKQGQKLDTINRDLNEIDADVHESRSVLSYMRRCCCCFLCACCCDGDRDVARDNTRKQRVKLRKELRSSEKALTASGGGAATQPPGSVQANGRGMGAEQGAREELFGEHAGEAAQAARRQQRRVPRNGARRIGENLQDADREEVQAETEVQEQALDQIGAALGDMRRLTQDMGEELRQQEAKIGALEEKTDRTQDNLTSLSTSAKKDFRLRGKSVNSGPSASRMITKAAARALA